jgi:hypothetical protein
VTTAEKGGEQEAVMKTETKEDVEMTGAGYGD